MFGNLVEGAGCVRGQGQEWMGCLLDDVRAFGFNADQWWMTTQSRMGGMPQGGGTRRGRTFHGEIDRCRESQGWTKARISMPERDDDGKDQGQDGPK